MFNLISEAFNAVGNWVVDAAETLGFIPIATLAAVTVVAFVADAVLSSRKGR